ncbi:MAG: MFS transporter [Candidatus Pacebacteria bacterium]|nr:MFS transporter [Candidatus Paceibacterota bacterium]
MPPVPPTPERRIFGLNRNIFLLGLTSFFNDFSNQMILAAFPAFFTSVLKAGAASLGIVEGIADGASNIIKIYSGQLSDKLRRRRAFIFLGYGMSVLIRPFYMITGSIAGVLGLRIVDRIGKGVREAPRDVIISVSAQNGDVGRSFGYHRAMDTAGGVLGPLAAYLILSYLPFGFNVIFLSAFIIGLIAVATIFFVKDVVIARDSNNVRIFSFKTFRSFSPHFRWYLFAIFIFSVGSLPSALLLLQTTNIGLVIASIPLFYMIYNIAFVLFSYGAGKLSDTMGTARVLAFGYTILAIGYVVLMIAATPLALALSFATLGLSSACTDAAQRAFVAKTTPDYERGTAYGMYNAVTGFGVMFSGIIGGFMWQHWSPMTALACAVAIVMVGLIVFYASTRVGRGVVQ